MSRLQVFINKSGMSQTQVAKTAGIDPATLSQLVNHPDKVRTAKVETIIKICETLQCNPSEILPIYSAQKEWKEIKNVESLTEKELTAVFTNEQKHYLCDMLNGSIYDNRTHPRNYLKMQIIDSDIYEGLGEKWNVKIDTFVKKIDGLTAAQCYVVIKTIAQFWDDNTKGFKPQIKLLFT